MDIICLCCLITLLVIINKRFNYMDKKDLLIKEFKDNFKKGEIYSASVISEFLEKSNNASIKNVAAYTYNRWNKGMTDILPMLEWLDRGEYKYLGEGDLYSGLIFHYPQGDNPYKIGEYKDGILIFYNPNISNFKQWKTSEYEGEKFAVKNSTVTFSSKDGKLNQKKKLTNDKNLIGKFENGVDYLDIDKPLGKILFNKVIGDVFVFGKTEYKITGIF